jgi:hypothetical protein
MRRLQTATHRLTTDPQYAALVTYADQHGEAVDADPDSREARRIEFQVGELAERHGISEDTVYDFLAGALMRPIAVERL